MRKMKNKKILVKSLLLGSFLLIIFSIVGIYFSDRYEQVKINNADEMNVRHFIESVNKKDVKDNNKDINETKEEYIAVITIPKINLSKPLAPLSSKLNNVDRNIEILKGSSMPSIHGGNLILASHSGSSKISHFKNLHKLSEKDKVYIYYNNMTFTYKVFKIYKTKKNGELQITRDKDKNILTLTTCDINSDTKQLVILSELIDVKEGYGF